MTFIFEGDAWDADTLKRIYDAVEPIALEDLGLDVYPNQRQIVSAEQMIDAYASIGMPDMYKHWSFGKRFAYDNSMYQKGQRGLAYELVINSSPCISYYMEENSAAMQLLTTAHAAFGHNHFFKNNYLFREWTDASFVLDYLKFAAHYVARCEEKYGESAVTRVLDAAHALMNNGVFRAKRPVPLTAKQRTERLRARREYERDRYSDLWYRTVPRPPVEAEDEGEDLEGKKVNMVHLPEENLLYFLEKYSPSLKSWEREILRIVRVISQYFYPQRQTKMMNEGCATFVHYYIINVLWERCLISNGAMIELMSSHSNVIFQPEWKKHGFRSFNINPYALGFKMMMDIKRVCEEPTAEDKEFLPRIAGVGDWRTVLRDAWAGYRDDSFIMQFLSPQLVRDFKFFSFARTDEEPILTVEQIHNDRGFKQIREVLSKHYTLAEHDPDIQVVDANFKGDRTLRLRHKQVHRQTLAASKAKQTLVYLSTLWTYPIVFESEDAEGTITPLFSVSGTDIKKLS